MNKVYAIVGPPASGKTSLVKELYKLGIPAMVTHTTRPKKKEEKNGIDYYFIKKENFSICLELRGISIKASLYIYWRRITDLHGGR